MKQLLLIFLLISSTVMAQKNDPEEVIRRVADNVIRNTSFQFVNSATGEKFASTKGRDTSFNVKAESRYNKWAYVNGVLTVGMIEMSKVLNDSKYSDYSKRNFDFIFSNLDYFFGKG